MPLYEYLCTQCGHRFEKIQKFAAQPDTVCPKCGGELRRPLTAPALQFKGSGWYVNDYAPKGGSGASAEKPDAGKPATDTAKPSTDAEKPAASESNPAESKSAGDSTSKPAAPSGSSNNT